MAIYVYELSEMAQYVLFNRIANDLEENGAEFRDATEKAYDIMENVGFISEYCNEEKVNILDILIPLGEGEYKDIFANPEYFTEAEAENVAIEWSYLQSECTRLSYGELMEVQNYFTTLVEKYPTLKEDFRENAIPFLE